MSKETDNFLEHYGVPGMKWGRRGSKKQTGVSRGGGAILDRNARNAKTLTDARSGVAHKRKVAFGKKIIGAQQWEKNFQTSMTNMAAQNFRIKAGKTTVSDKIDMLVGIDTLDLVISRRPKDE